MKATSGQIFAFNKLIGAVTKNRKERLWIAGQILGREIESTSDLERSEWVSVRDQAYPWWHGDDWTIGPDFSRKLISLSKRYEVEVAGQTLLFGDS